MAPTARFVACVAPKLLEKHTYTGTPQTDDQWFELTMDEARTLASQMTGIPVKVKHHPNTSVGKVTKAYVDNQNRLMATFEIPLDGFGMSQANLVNRQHYVGVSLLHNQRSMEPAELTICQEGAREGAFVEYRLPTYEAKFHPETGEYIPPPQQQQDATATMMVAASSKSNPFNYTHNGMDIWVLASRNSSLSLSLEADVDTSINMSTLVAPFQAPAVISGNYPVYMPSQTTPAAAAAAASAGAAPILNPIQPPRGPDGRWLPLKTDKEHEEAAANQAQAQAQAQAQTQAQIQGQQQQQQQQQADPQQSWLFKAAQQGQGANFSAEELDYLRNYLKVTASQNQDLAAKTKQLESAKQQLDKQQQTAKEAVVQSLKEMMSAFIDEGKPVPKERFDAWSSAITDNNMSDFVMSISNDLVAASNTMRRERERYQQLLQQVNTTAALAPQTTTVAPQLAFHENQYNRSQANSAPRYDESFLRSVSTFLGPQVNQQQQQQQDQWVAASSNKRSRPSEFDAPSSAHSYSHQNNTIQPSQNSTSTSSRTSPWDISRIEGINCTTHDAEVFNSVMQSTKGLDMHTFDPKQFYSKKALDRMSMGGGFGTGFGQDGVSS